MSHRVAVYSASFDPPTLHHRNMALRLSEQFDAVIIVPVGARQRPGPLADSLPVSRATMADLNFRGISNVTVDLTDLEQGIYTPPHLLIQRYEPQGQVWLVVADEMVRDSHAGQSCIQKDWHNGGEFFATTALIVFHERGVPLAAEDHPPRSLVLEHDQHISSEVVRSMLNQGDANAAMLLHTPVYGYIDRHGLYRDVPSDGRTMYRPASPRFRLYVDEWKEASKNIGELLEPYSFGEHEMVVAVGGDGTMLRAIRKHWRERLPFYGINTGHLGFLLSGRDVTTFWKEEMLLYQLPLLQVEVEMADGSKHEAVAFNEAWVERERGQTAWLKVSVNGVERISKLVGDGVLLSTAAGSTSYARAMGASPVPLNTSVLLLLGSNVLQPASWRPAVLPLDAVVEFETLDSSKRPLRGYFDGEEFHGTVKRMKVRVSRTAAVELAFAKGYDPFAKLAEVQFPTVVEEVRGSKRP
jgi:NAD+ kinase